MTKKEIYAKHNIVFENGKIYHEKFGFIPCLLIDGNTKIGNGVYHFSTLPTKQIFHVVINGRSYDVKGTCPCTCDGCYATKGRYNCDSVITSNAIKTLLVYEDLDFVKRAIIAQIEADNILFLRIHASGDFFSEAYVVMWQEIVKTCKKTVFWTYTKYEKAEDAFLGVENAHVVPSVIKGKGFNFGHCDHVLAMYEYLTSMEKSVYICRCGIDKNQHCVNCKACSKYDFVLFLEHSTDYKAEKDPLFPIVKNLIESQDLETR